MGIDFAFNGRSLVNPRAVGGNKIAKGRYNWPQIAANRLTSLVMCLSRTQKKGLQG